eukprot:snap_masked-scaffold_31-processed-gene-3.45-mRNA-1 protein AED:1.00 eAED:1.00 QI:0/0/0/0/1/1/2/0/59
MLEKAFRIFKNNHKLSDTSSTFKRSRISKTHLISSGSCEICGPASSVCLFKNLSASRLF